MNSVFHVFFGSLAARFIGWGGLPIPVRDCDRKYRLRGRGLHRCLAQLRPPAGGSGGTGAFHARRRRWPRAADDIVVSDGAERQEVAGRRPLGDRRRVRASEVIENVARNFARQPVKEGSLAMIARAQNLRTGTIQMMQAGKQRLEQRAAEGKPESGLAATFRSRRDGGKTRELQRASEDVSAERVLAYREREAEKPRPAAGVGGGCSGRAGDSVEVGPTLVPGDPLWAALYDPTTTQIGRSRSDQPVAEADIQSGRTVELASTGSSTRAGTSRRKSGSIIFRSETEQVSVTANRRAYTG